jgi:hypothetical protein
MGKNLIGRGSRAVNVVMCFVIVVHGKSSREGLHSGRLAICMVAYVAQWLVSVTPPLPEVVAR